ncbi:MAG: hypothetical protein K8E66_00265 [Phycisphaerales bacterium]|nr:hypothetical protein [Phycisphaerales bacterium]
MPVTDEHELFREEQPMHQNMIVRVVMPFEMFITAAILLPLAFGPSRSQMIELLIVYLLSGVVLPWWVMTLRLVTIVSDRRLVIRFRPMPGRDIPVTEITRAASVRYNPLGDGGGWGWRMSGTYHRIFNVSGDRGVHVRFGEGKRDQFRVGSRRPDELAEAIELARFEAAGGLPLDAS